MIKTIKVSMVLMISSSMLLAAANQMQKYEVESGKIEYSIKGSSDMMGMKMKTIGKKRVIFADYGVQDLTEENQITKETLNGKTKTTKKHSMTYMKDGIIFYTVDFDAKRIMRMENMGIALGALMSDGTNMKESGEAMMIKMGGKKTGTDKILGYTCDVWNLMGTRQCMYKGIPLKVETNMMGILNTEVATKVEFEISLSKDDFKLPDFPIYDTQGNKLDKSKLESMDKQAEIEAVQASKDMTDFRKRMEDAAKSAGIKEGERPIKAQEKKMEEAMMVGMLPRIKEKILSQENTIIFAKECLSEADTLKEANECNHKTNGMSDIEEEDFDEWNPKAKKEMLVLLDQGFQVMECVKKAQSMDAVQQCMSEE